MSAVTASQLESHLWEAANILHGPVDVRDFKTRILPMLFFKRLCEVDYEEAVKAVWDSDGEEHFALFPENHCSGGCRRIPRQWPAAALSSWLESSTAVGLALATCLRSK